MDHAMSYLYDYMSYSVDDLKKEFNSGSYSKLSECPSYKEVKAYCDSYNALERYYHVENQRHYLKPSELVRGY